MLTEAEAKTKWCPFVRASGTNRITPKPITDNEPFAGCAVGACIASSCMAWRWAESATEYRIGYSEGGERLDEPEGVDWVESGGGWTRPRNNRLGYCGLAGTP